MGHLWWARVLINHYGHLIRSNPLEHLNLVVIPMKTLTNQNHSTLFIFLVIIWLTPIEIFCTNQPDLSDKKISETAIADFLLQKLYQHKILVIPGLPLWGMPFPWFLWRDTTPLESGETLDPGWPPHVGKMLSISTKILLTQYYHYPLTFNVMRYIFWYDKVV